MLDYQINESISKAYVESVCNHCRRKSKVNEDNNVVSRVSMPIADMRSGAESSRRSKLTPEEIEKEDRFRKRWEKEYAKKQSLRDYERRQTYISAAPEQAPRRPTATLTSGNAYRDSITGSGPSSDPAMRIGKGVYDGIGYMLPAAFVGKTAKAAKLGKELASQGKRIAALEQAASKGGGGVMKWMLSPKGNVTGAALGAAANYGSDELRKRGYDKAADVVDEFKWLGAMPGPIGYGVANLGYGRMVRGQQNQTDGNASNQPVDTRVSCPLTGCNFIAPNQDALDMHYIKDHGYSASDL